MDFESTKVHLIQVDMKNLTIVLFLFILPPEFA